MGSTTLEEFWAACMRDRGSEFSFWNEENTYFLKGVGEMGNDGKGRAVVGGFEGGNEKI